MNRTAVALLAALESVIASAIGLGIALVPLTVLWAVKYGMAVSWSVFWRAACDLWLLGHGVDLHIALDAKTALALGLPGAGSPFSITIAALGCGLLVVVLGLRVGRRAARTPYPQVGVISALAAYCAVAALVTVSAQDSLVRPMIWQGILLPVFVFAIGVVGGAVSSMMTSGTTGSAVTASGVTASGMTASGAAAFGSVATAGGQTADTAGHSAGVPTGLEGSVRRAIDAIPAEVRRGLSAALRGGSAATALILGVSAILLALAFLIRFSSIVGLYQGLQTGVAGGAVLTLAQLAFLPNLIIWVASWLVGPGFAIGTGSSVSPLGTALGPLPSVPVLGALPHGSLAFGFLGILVPVVAGLAAALLVVFRERSSSPSPAAIGSLVVTGIGIGVVAGALIGLAAWWSSGAIGPGRLADAGPDAVLVGLLAAAETGVAGVVGMIAGSRMRHG